MAQCGVDADSGCALAALRQAFSGAGVGHGTSFCRVCCTWNCSDPFAEILQFSCPEIVLCLQVRPQLGRTTSSVHTAVYWAQPQWDFCVVAEMFLTVVGPQYIPQLIKRPWCRVQRQKEEAGRDSMWIYWHKRLRMLRWRERGCGQTTIKQTQTRKMAKWAIYYCFNRFVCSLRAYNSTEEIKWYMGYHEYRFYTREAIR